MIKMSSVAEVGCERSGTRVPSIEQQGEARVPSMDGARRKANKSLTHRLSSHTDSRQTKVRAQSRNSWIKIKTKILWTIELQKKAECSSEFD